MPLNLFTTNPGIRVQTADKSTSASILVGGAIDDPIAEIALALPGSLFTATASGTLYIKSTRVVGDETDWDPIVGAVQSSWREPVEVLWPSTELLALTEVQ